MSQQFFYNVPHIKCFPCFTAKHLIKPWSLFQRGTCNAWESTESICIDRMDGIAQIVPESIVKCSLQRVAKPPSSSKPSQSHQCCECETQSFSSLLSFQLIV